MTDAALQERREWVLAILERYEAPLARYAIRLLGDEQCARDAVQHAFLQLCSQSPAQLRDRIAPWLFTVCRNKAMDLVRSRRRAGRAHEGETSDHPSRETDPAVAAERQDLYVRLRQLLAELPPRQREAIDLWVEGFTYREIAQIAGRTEGHVRVLVHRALKYLRQHPLARHLVGEPEASGALPSARCIP